MRYIIAIFSLMLLMSAALAGGFECKLVLNKAPCWENFDVTLEFYDGISLKHVKDFKIGKGTFSKTVKFDCSKMAAFTFKAYYRPLIWKNREHLKYPASSTWQIPTSLDEGDSIWLATICFSKNFRGVPLPFSDITRCQCPAPKDKDDKGRKTKKK